MSDLPDDLEAAQEAAMEHADEHHDPSVRGAFRAGASFVIEYLDKQDDPSDDA